MDVRKIASSVLIGAAWIARMLGVLFALLACALCFGRVMALVPVADATFWLQSFVPDVLLGLFVFSSPFGGAFRGDFALASLIFFIIDWALVRTASAVR